MRANRDLMLYNMIHAPTSQEALPWLRDGLDERSLGNLNSRIESIKLVKILFELGALNVFACEIDKYDWGENTGKLVIELPEDVELRKQLFSWSGIISVNLGFDPTPDDGRKFLFVMLD